jgi:cytochrome c peroxidase
MTIVNMFSDDLFFWDGRIDNLKEMVLMPIQNHIEMGIDNMEVLVNKVSKRTYYPELFKNAFGSEEVTIDRISDALSSFVGSIGSYQTKFDKVSKGEASYTNLEAEGAKLFFNQFDCDHCHALQNKINSDKNFANIGLNIVDSDPGRQGLFKIPDLRNVAITGPYMHDGRFATLEEVVSHYSSSIQPNKNLDSSFKRPVYGNNFESIRGLDMTEGQKRALIAFLNTLTDIPLITDPKFSDPFEPN